MNRPSLRRTLVLVLLAATLVTPWAGAADLRPETSTPQTVASLGPLGLFDQIWVLLTGLWNKEGCVIDPDGLHATGGTGSGDEGCILDPSGLCVAATPVQGEEGCVIDPNGLCIR